MHIFIHLTGEIQSFLLLKQSFALIYHHINDTIDILICSL